METVETSLYLFSTDYKHCVLVSFPSSQLNHLIPCLPVLFLLLIAVHIFDKYRNLLGRCYLFPTLSGGETRLTFPRMTCQPTDARTDRNTGCAQLQGLG